MPVEIDYDDLVTHIYEDSGNTSALTDFINSQEMTPSEFYAASSTNQVDEGLVRYINNDGNTRAFANNINTTLTDGGVGGASINSNTQSGTAAKTVNIRYATNTSVDPDTGKVVAENGVTKYDNGTPTSGAPAVVSNVMAGIGAYATGVALGKAIDSALYNINPTFWDSVGMSSLNPETWASITSDVEDTGLMGVAKKTFNFLLGINPDGSTQAYMEKDAFNQMAYALAQTGMFDTGAPSTQAAEASSAPSAAELQASGTYTFTGSTSPFMVPDASKVGGIIYRGPNSSYGKPRYNLIVFSKGAMSGWQYVSGWGVRAYNMDINCGSGYYCASSFYGIISGNQNDPTTPFPYFTFGRYLGDDIILPRYTSADAALKYLVQQGVNLDAYINRPAESTLPGTSDQHNATVPPITSSDTAAQVADKISGALPNLHNNRIEQTVAREDGTTDTVVYYPVPTPTSTVNTTIGDPQHITTQNPIQIILPDGVSITLPDGTVVKGDGVTVITLPAGTYDLPSGTVIVGNPVTDPDAIGGTQASPTVSPLSNPTAQQTMTRRLTDPEPQPTADPTADPLPEPAPNPSDIGTGTSPVTPMPSGSASALFTVYAPDTGILNSFGAWLWSSNFIDQVLKLFNDPMQAIIGLHKTYIPPAIGGNQNIVVGYLDSGVSCPTIPTQYTSVDCGTVSLAEYFGNIFDYSPYTRVYIYLPFVGFKELDVSQVMRSSINVKYHGDAYTGAGLAEVRVTRDGGAGGVLYTYACDVAAKYPLSSGSYMGIISGIASVGVGAAGIVSGNIGMAMSGLHGVTSQKRTVEHSGGFSGNSGVMGIKKPYLVVMRPQTAMANHYEHFTGQPSNSYVKIGNASGFIRCKEVHVESINAATDEEKSMIERALKEGVIL